MFKVVEERPTEGYFLVVWLEDDKEIHTASLKMEGGKLYAFWYDCWESVDSEAYNHNTFTYIVEGE